MDAKRSRWRSGGVRKRTLRGHDVRAVIGVVAWCANTAVEASGRLVIYRGISEASTWLAQVWRSAGSAGGR